MHTNTVDLTDATQEYFFLPRHTHRMLLLLLPQRRRPAHQDSKECGRLHHRTILVVCHVISDKTLDPRHCAQKNFANMLALNPKLKNFSTTFRTEGIHGWYSPAI